MRFYFFICNTICNSMTAANIFSCRDFVFSQPLKLEWRLKRFVDVEVRHMDEEGDL